MSRLRGLAGVRGALPAVHVRSVSGAVSRMREGRAVTAAGSEGALNVWRDDRGQLRSEFMRYHQTLDAAQHDTVASLRRWLMTWWPRLERGR